MSNIKIKYTPPYAPYKSFRKLHEYLYEVEYDKLDYSDAVDYYRASGDFVPSACSSVRNGMWYGRNLDWTYNRQVEFVVHTTHTDDHYASLGIAGGFTALLGGKVDASAFIEEYSVLPFQLYDGINEYGVFANMNVVPTDKGHNVSEPELVTKHQISALMLIRFILDRFSTAQQALSYIRDYVSVYFPKGAHTLGYEIHYMIGDMNSTYALEFVNNKAVIIDISTNAVLTNFYLDGVTFNSGNTVYTPETQSGVSNAVDYNHVTERGSGLERYNLIQSKYSTLTSYQSMRDLMNELTYTRTYASSPSPASPMWHTEFTGTRGLACNSDVADFALVEELADLNYQNRTRDDLLTWHTTHSGVYDIEHQELYLQTQEVNSIEYRFVIQYEDNM